MKNLKKVLSLVVVFAMVLSFASVASASVFPDVSDDSSYADAINLLYSLKVVGGDDKGNFNPESTITRAEFAKILFVLMNGTPDATMFTGPSQFDDVSTESWYIGYINWASNQNIVGGKGNGMFAPNDPVTVAEATKMFIVALTGKSTLAWPYGFISEAYKQNINLFKDANITNPDLPAQRQVIAQMAKNAIFATDVANFYTYGDNGQIAERGTVATNVFGIKTVVTVLEGTSKDVYNTDIGKTVATQLPNLIQLRSVQYQAPTDNTPVVYGTQEGPFQYNGNVDGMAKKLVSVYFKDINNDNTLDVNDVIVNVSENYNRVLTFKASEAYTDPITKKYYVEKDGVKTELVFSTDFASTCEEWRYNAATGQYETRRVVDQLDDPYTFDTIDWDYYFNAVDDFEITLIGNGSTSTSIDTKFYTVIYKEIYNNLKITALTDTAAVSMIGLQAQDAANAAASGSYNIKDANGNVLVKLYEGAKVGDIVNATITKSYTGYEALEITQADTLSGVIYQKRGTVTGSNLVVYTFNGQQYYVNDNYSLGSLILGEPYDLVLDSAGNIIYCVGAESADLGTLGIITAIRRSNSGLGGASYEIDVLTTENVTKKFYIADQSTLARLGYTLEIDTEDATPNAWFDPVKGFLTTDGKYTENPTGYPEYDGNTDYEKIRFLNRAVRYEVIPTKTDTIYKLATIKGIEDALATNPTYSYTAHYSNDVAINPTTGAVSVGGTIVGFTTNATVGFSYDAATASAKVYNSSNLPSANEATAYFLVETMKNSNVSNIVAIEFLDLGSFLPDKDGIAAIINYSMSLGSQTGYVKYEIYAAFGGSITTIETIEEALSAGVIGPELAKASGGFAQLTFSADNKVAAVVPVNGSQVNDNYKLTTIPDWSKASGWGIGTVKSVQGNFVQISNVDSITTTAATASSPAQSKVELGSAASYFMTNVDTKVYTINGYAPSTSGNTFASNETPIKDTVNVGSTANLIPGSTFANYIIVYHWTTDYASSSVQGSKVIDAVFVYTLPSSAN